MAAKATEVTHFLFESKPLWSGRIGAAGVSDAVVTTIPLESATNLTNGNAYVFRMGRVDANGVKRDQNLTEVSIGKLSGTNFINCVRGSEGTAQEFAAGVVVEVLFTSTHWDKLIEFLGVEHGPTGIHTSALVTTLKATGAEVNTGTEDAKIVTPKAIADSTIARTKAAGTDITTGTDDTKYVTSKAIKDAADGLITLTDVTTNNVSTTKHGFVPKAPNNTTTFLRGDGSWAAPTATALSSKLLGTTRDMTAATGNVSYTGIGFQPTSLRLLACIVGGLIGSDGFADSARTAYCVGRYGTSGLQTSQVALAYVDVDAANNKQTCVVASYDADGFTLTWTKTGSPTGTLVLNFICYK